MLLTISHPPPTFEHSQSVNRFHGGSGLYTAMNCIVVFLNQVLHGQSLQSVLVYNFTNMHPMSCRLDFVLVAVESIFWASRLLHCIITFGSLSSWITHLSNSYRQVRFTICEHLIALGYDPFRKCTSLYSWFDRPYIANHLRSLVGFNECKLEAACCLEWF
jgi:hypothetical protein